MELKEATSEEIMNERGTFTANGYTFVVEPIYTEEAIRFREDVPYFLYPRNEDGTPVEELTKYDLALFIIRLFNSEKETAPNVETGLLDRVKLWLVKHCKKKYEHYTSSPDALLISKWVEKKVTYKGKHIKFQDLERKFKLTKSEIAQLLGYFENISFFQ